MNNDIKETLDDLKLIATLNEYKITQLIDYITNLREKETYYRSYYKYYKNITDEAIGIANERVNFYHHINDKEHLEEWKEIFDTLCSYSILGENNE